MRTFMQVEPSVLCLSLLCLCVYLSPLFVSVCWVLGGQRDLPPDGAAHRGCAGLGAEHDRAPHGGFGEPGHDVLRACQLQGTGRHTLQRSRIRDFEKIDVNMGVSWRLRRECGDVWWCR